MPVQTVLSIAQSNEPEAPVLTRTRKSQSDSTSYDGSNVQNLDLTPAGLNPGEVKLFHRLVDAIAERRLAPGVKLVEDELAAAFGVSRERVRRILLALSQYRIVRIEPNKGAFVSRPSPAERREAFDLRLVLERHVVRTISHMPLARQKVVIKDLREHIEREDDAMRENNRARQIKLTGEFHLRLAAGTGNWLLVQTLQETVAFMSLAFAAHAYHQDLGCSLGEHQRLVDAIEKGEADKAEALLVEHLGHLEEDMAYNISASSELELALRPSD